MIKQGDRVKLTARAATTVNNKGGGKSVWTGRRGVVLRIATNKADAVVLWDGRVSREYLPIGAIESESATQPAIHPAGDGDPDRSQRN